MAAVQRVPTLGLQAGGPRVSQAAALPADLFQLPLIVPLGQPTVPLQIGDEVVRTSDAVLPGTEQAAAVEPSPPASFPLQDGPPAMEAPRQDPPPGDRVAPLECYRYTNRRRKSQGLLERWWLEYDPPKANYISAYGRGPFKGHSINKADWPRMMLPSNYRKKFQIREKNRHAFRKHGYEMDIPKWGG